MITQANTAGVGPALPRRELLGVALGGLILAACRPKAGPVRVRIGYQKSGVLLLAKARGGLEAALAGVGPVAVEWIEFVAGPPMLEAMRARAIDIGAVGDTPPIFAQSGGDPILYAAAVPNADAAEGVIVPAASPIRSVHDLKGRKIGLTRGSSSHLLLLEALKSAGMTIADVRAVYLSPPDAASAFSSGAIEAWTIWDPYLALAQARAPTRTLINRGDLPPSNSFILAQSAFAQAAPKVLGAMLDFLAAESAWGNAHVPDAARIIAASTGIPLDICALTLRRAPLAIRPMTSFAVARQQAAADAFYTQGFIPAPIKVASAVWTGWKPAG